MRRGGKGDISDIEELDGRRGEGKRRWWPAEGYI